MKSTELSRIDNIIDAFNIRNISSVSYYGRTFTSLKEFLEYRKNNNL